MVILCKNSANSDNDHNVSLQDGAIGMCSKSFGFEYASRGKNPADSALIRLMGVIVLLLTICGTGGCIATQLKATSNRPVVENMDVFVHAMIQQHTMDTICIFPFASAPEIEAASASLTSAFKNGLVQRRPFREVTLLSYQVKSDPEALWYARNAGCTLLMRPLLLYMMDGSGNLPTKLVVRIRILDARTGEVLWDVKQTAWSEPGPDIDLTWNTITGEPAQRCGVIADCLAQRFASYLTQPLEKKE